MEVISVKFKITTVLLVGLLGLAGCGIEDSNYDNNFGNPNDNSYQPRGVINETANNDRLDDFGYSRVQQPLTNEQMIKNNAPQIDRRQLAQFISSTAVLAPKVEDVSTLVTDKYVFIAYSTNAENRNLIADQVKKTALSVVPRYYHVYVSDDPHARPLIDRYQGLDAETEHVNDSIDAMIKEFKKSPQGEKIGTDENENGEHAGDKENNNNF